MVGGEHSLKMSAPQLLWFGIDSVLKILNKKARPDKSMNDEGVYKTAPTTPGLVKIDYPAQIWKIVDFNGIINCTYVSKVSAPFLNRYMLTIGGVSLVRVCALPVNQAC